jgi:hypothetical protein
VQAVVCRDSQGHILKALSQISPPCEANFGEALAAQLTASLAVSLDLKTFSLEGDSSVVIAALKTPALPQGHILKALSQISPPCEANFGEALAAS